MEIFSWGTSHPGQLQAPPWEMEHVQTGSAGQWNLGSPSAVGGGRQRGAKLATKEDYACVEKGELCFVHRQESLAMQ